MVINQKSERKTLEDKSKLKKINEKKKKFYKGK